MNRRLLLLLFVFAVCAQAQAVPCGYSPAVAADSVPSGRTSPVAAKADTSRSKGPSPDVTNIAAQIKQRRPVPVQPSTSCRCGTVGAGSLTAQSNSQEVPILTGLSGTFRFVPVMVQETVRLSFR